MLREKVTECLIEIGITVASVYGKMQTKESALERISKFCTEARKRLEESK